MSKIANYLSVEIQGKADLISDIIADETKILKEQVDIVLDELFDMGLIDLNSFKEFMKIFDEDEDFE